LCTLMMCIRRCEVWSLRLKTVDVYKGVFDFITPVTFFFPEIRHALKCGSDRLLNFIRLRFCVAFKERMFIPILVLLNKLP
jgi:hypothetical protein